MSKKAAASETPVKEKVGTPAKEAKEKPSKKTVVEHPKESQNEKSSASSSTASTEEDDKVELFQPDPNREPEPSTWFMPLMFGISVCLMIAMGGALAATTAGGASFFRNIPSIWPPTLTSVMPKAEHDYGFVLFTILCTVVHVWFTGISVGALRHQVLGREYIEAVLGDESKDIRNINKVGIVSGCLPDNGDGRLSYRLGWAEWLELNTAQRVYEDYLQCQTIVVVGMGIMGLWWPIWASGLGWLHIFARWMYGAGYRLNVRSRSFGYYLSWICIVILCVFSALAALRLTNLLHFYDPKLKAAAAAAKAEEYARIAKDSPTSAAWLKSAGLDK